MGHKYRRKNRLRRYRRGLRAIGKGYLPAHATITFSSTPSGAANAGWYAMDANTANPSSFVQQVYLRHILDIAGADTLRRVMKEK